TSKSLITTTTRIRFCTNLHIQTDRRRLSRPDFLASNELEFSKRVFQHYRPTVDVQPIPSPIIPRPDRPILLAHRKTRDRFVSRRLRHRPRAQVEARAMPRTFDFETEHLAAGQVATIMRAGVFHRVQCAVDVVNRDRGVAVPHHLEFARQEVAAGADPDPSVHAVASPKSFSSTSKRRSSRRGMPKRSSP